MVLLSSYRAGPASGLAACSGRRSCGRGGSVYWQQRRDAGQGRRSPWDVLRCRWPSSTANLLPPMRRRSRCRMPASSSARRLTDYCRNLRPTALPLFRCNLERFRRDCAACFVPLAFDDGQLLAFAEALLERGLRPGEESALVTFATPGPLASLGGAGGPTLVMHAFPIPAARYRPFFAEGASLHPFAGEPVFPEAKHRSRLHWWRAAHLVPDVPLLVAGDAVCETAIGNVLLARGQEIVAAPPPLVLDGVSPQRVTRELCPPWRWRETAFTVDDCLAADEALLVGSAFGNRPPSRASAASPGRGAAGPTSACKRRGTTPSARISPPCSCEARSRPACPRGGRSRPRRRRSAPPASSGRRTPRRNPRGGCPAPCEA